MCRLFVCLFVCTEGVKVMRVINDKARLCATKRCEVMHRLRLGVLVKDTYVTRPKKVTQKDMSCTTCFTGHKRGRANIVRSVTILPL